MPKKLKACPFCGTHRTRLHEWNDGALILCECGAKGPESSGEYRANFVPMACDLWNQRKQIPLTPAALVR